MSNKKVREPSKVITGLYREVVKRGYNPHRLRAGLTRDGWSLSHTSFVGTERTNMRVEEYFKLMSKK